MLQIATTDAESLIENLAFYEAGGTHMLRDASALIRER
jgi:hypothetical protein